MRKQSIIWTALPHGRTGDTLNLSVFIAPRLWDDTSQDERLLSVYDDFLNWPARIGAATFDVSFNGGAPLPATKVKPGAVSADVWGALFNATTRVVPFRFESMLDTELVCPSSVTIHDIIKRIYQTVATDPAYRAGSDLPPRGTLARNDDVRDVAWPTRPRPNVQHVPDDPRPKPGPPWVPTVPEPEPGPAKPPQKKPGCGCAGCLALPLALLRRLLKMIGMIAMLPFTMGVGGFTGASASNAKRDAFRTLHAAVDTPTSEISEDMPSTAELAQRYDFHEMIATLGDYPNLLRYCGLVVDLQVTIDDSVAAAGTVEVHPHIGTDASITHHHRPRTHYELTADQFLAATAPVGGDLHNGLLRVDDENRFVVMQLDIAGSAIKVQQMATSVVSREAHDEWSGNDEAEEGLPALQSAGLSIVRPGYATHLRERFEASEALNNAIAAADDSPPGDPSIPPRMDLFAEDLVRGYRVDVWDDKSTRWHSLCQRIGTYDFDGIPPLENEEDEGFVQASAVEPIREQAERVLRVHESLFSWNGWSLGAPRYGRTILSTPGFKTEIDDPPNEPATAFKLKASFVPPAKSLPRLRFGYEYKMRVRAADLAGNSVFKPGEAAFLETQDEVTKQIRYRRFEPIPPPMVMLQRVPVEGESLERVVVRSKVGDDGPTLALQESARHVIPPKTSQQMAEIHRKFDGPTAMKNDVGGYDLASREAGSITHRVKADGSLEQIGGVEPVKPGAAEHLQKNPTFAVSYLPDPYARGVLFLGLPGLGADDVIDGVNRILFEGKWPDPQPFRLVVQAIGAGLGSAAPVWSPGERTLTVQVAQGETHRVRFCSILKGTDLPNMATWQWIEETAVVDLPKLRQQAEQGRNWLTLPFRRLTLVHAVQQPLEIPKLGAMTTTRTAGETLAALHGSCVVDAKSTEKIDVHARWEDPIDDPKQPAPGLLPHAMHIDEVKCDGVNAALSLEGLQHSVPDTKYHAVTYRAVATSRFREYFPEAVWNDMERPKPGEAAPDAERHGVDVLNTARPDAPKLLYIVPAFAWARTGMTHTRHAGGLRVYLERPWYSSGDGELLGITLRRPGTAPGSLPKYTSEWGMDPLWPAEAMKPLSLDQFADPDGFEDNVLLAEDPNAFVDVVGYKPEFDPERNLWYCDIRMKTQGAYFPMVRLALVRFQPKSVEGVHISPVVLANFIQTLPQRRVTYDTSQLATLGRVEVEVRGPAFVRNENDDTSTSRMIVRLEKRSGLGASDELGWEPVASTVLPATKLKKEDVIWKGAVDAGSVPPPSPMRIVVLEVEPYFTESPSNVDMLDILAKGAVLPGLNMTKDDLTMGYRVTFADAMEVP